MPNNALNAPAVSAPYQKGPILWDGSPVDYSGYGLGPFNVETTKRYEYGARFLTRMGSVYRYAYASTGGVASEFGACNNHGGGADSNTTGPVSNTISSATAPTQVGDATGVIGSICVTVKIFTGNYHGEIGDGIVAKDELVGGYLILGNGTSQHPDIRLITANTATAASATGTIQVYLEWPITQTITAGTTNIEVLANPYSKSVSMYYLNSAYVSCIGFPAATAAATYSYWLQTWGPHWGSSAGATNDGVNDRDIFVGQNGIMVSSADIVEGSTNPLFQRIGFTLEKTSSGHSGPPLCMLQISI